MTNNLLKALFSLILLSLPFQSGAGTILDAERAVGVIKLGMSGKEFKKITGIKPGYCPGDSARGETCASIDCRKTPNLCKATPDVTDIDVIFWKNKIYYLLVGMNEIPIEKAEKHYTNKFGNSLENFSQGTPGLRIIKWGNKATEISVQYSVGDKKAFVLRFKDLSQNTDAASF